MTEDNATFAYKTIDDKIFEAKIIHFNWKKMSFEYNEKLFMHDNEILQKAMNTIKIKN